MTRPVHVIGPVGGCSYFGEKIEARRKHARALNRVSRLVMSPKAYQRAAELVEGGFAKETLARDAQGKEVDVASPNAVSFCIMGAMMRAGIDLGILPQTDDTWSDPSPAFNWSTMVGPVTQAMGDKPHDGAYGHRSANAWNNDPKVTQEDVVAALRGADPSRIHNPLGGGIKRYV